MKKLVIALSLFFVMGLASPVSAQNINININVNVDKQPSWGPVGYDYAEYYYFPDLNIYYDVASSLFYYLTSGNWTSHQYLPDKYRKYDLYNMYKVVLNDPQPWVNNKTHKKSYSQYKGDKTQESIRYSSNSKYDTSKNNNRRWVETGKNNNQPTTNNNQSTTNKKQSTDNNKGKNGNTSGNNNGNNNKNKKSDNSKNGSFDNTKNGRG